MATIYIIFVLFSCGFVSVSASTLPDYIKPCSKSDPQLNECAREHGNEAIPYILKGDKRYGLPPLVPLRLPEVAITPGDNLKLKLRNCVLSGIESVKLKDINIDLKNQKVHVSAMTDILNLEATYDINGRILILPIIGHGPANITAVNGQFSYSFDFDIIDKRGKEYILVKSPKIGYKLQRAYFYLGNLFNGDRLLGNQMNKFLDENWEDVLTDLGPAISETISTIVTTIFKSYLNKIPYEDIFLP